MWRDDLRLSRFVFSSGFCVALFLGIMLSPWKSFGQIALGQAKFLGNAVSLPIPSSYLIYWDQIVPAGWGKWGSVASSSSDTSTWNWGPLDQIYNYAMTNGISFKEHNLVWGQQQPSWISSLDSAHQYQMVETWIRLCGERYPEAAMVDVVNEPLHDTPMALNPVPYYKALGGAGATGWDWVITAFTLARQYFPNAKLLLNDYFILSSPTLSSQSEVVQYRTIIDLLKQRNLIDGIGCEGHFMEQTDTNTIRTNLNYLAASGLPIYITEYTVDEASDATQLAVYQKQFPIFWTHPDVKGVTLWGYIQGNVWTQTPNCYLIRSDSTMRPALQWLINYIEENPAGVKDTDARLPLDYALEQNYPNPFNPTTVISYRLPNVSNVALKIYDVLGREVATLVNGRQAAGYNNITFNAANLPSGVYFCKIVAEKFSSMRKLLLMK